MDQEEAEVREAEQQPYGPLLVCSCKDVGWRRWT
jgi:hypothetical protein